MGTGLGGLSRGLKRHKIHFQTKTAIDHAYRIAKSVGDNLENTILVWEDYGKDFIKKSRVSPDAYCQMAIQLTYFKVKIKPKLMHFKLF